MQRQWYDGSKHGKVSKKGKKAKKAMDQHQFLAERFEADRAHLRSVAYRMLGSISDAEDAVQETWLRLSRADTSGVDNLTGWLTTVVARVSLDMLRPSWLMKGRTGLGDGSLDQAGFKALHEPSDLIDLAFADIGRRPDIRDRCNA